jgi:6-phosphogluconolactonase (cycloisomerase 2 family)
VEQKQAKPHFAAFDPSGRFLLVPDKGLDRVFVFGFDRQQGRLSEQPLHAAVVREGAGPRHLAFHPSRPWVYVVNELDSSVTAYRFDVGTGALQPFQWLPTLPQNFTGNSRAAGIAVDPSGRRLYASNRGHDSVAVFRIDAVSGALTFEGADASQGRTPRFFTLAPDARTMFVLNEDSDGIVAFEVAEGTGRLQKPQGPIACGSPVCMVFAPG